MRLISIWSLTPKLGLVAMLGCAVDDEQLILDQRSAKLESGIERQELTSVEGLSGLDKFTWSEPVNLGPPVNTSGIEIMPTLSRDGRRLYFVSDRQPGGFGLTDIWVSRRTTIHSPWETPVNLGAMINSPRPEADPALSSDGRLLFFSTNRQPEGEGRLDVYVSQRQNPNDDLGWGPPVNLGPNVNTTAGDRGADYVLVANAPAQLYFGRGIGLIQADIYSAPITHNGEPLAAAEIVGELSALNAVTGGPSLRMDAKEIFFMSNRGGLGLDIWVSSRENPHEAWSKPENVAAVNTDFAEERPDLSFDGRTLLFDSDRPHADGLEDQDIWMSTRMPGGN